MSNLTDLLPAGAGGKQVSFVASGTIGNGVTVALNSDGTVTAVGTSIAEALGTPSSQFGSSDTRQGEYSSAYDSVNEKIVVAYRDSANLNYGTAIVGTVSGSTISFGSPVVYESGSVPEQAVVYDVASGKIVIAYIDEGNSSQGTAVVGTVSGTSISFGTPVVFETGNTAYIAPIYDTNAEKIVLYYTDFGNSQYGTSIVGTVSGTTISFGTPVLFVSGYAIGTAAVYDSTSQKSVIAYRNFSLSSRGESKVGTVSGTSISFGSVNSFRGQDTSEFALAYDSNENKIVLVFNDTQVPIQHAEVAIGTVSGTSISYGTASIFNAFRTNRFALSYDPNSKKVVFAYRNIDASNQGYVKYGTVSGSSITMSSPLLLNNESSSGHSTIYVNNVSKMVITSELTTGAKSVTYQPPYSISNTDFIGISDAVISDTASGSVTIKGGISTNVTGLTPNALYYVQADGSLSGAGGIPYDIVSASLSTSFSISAQQTLPTGLAFSADGTKMFTCGELNSDVDEYTLSTAYDVSTASYSQNFSIAGQETEPTGIAFNTDGTKMFVLGNVGNDVNEYALSTGFDVSTASFSQAFSISAQEATPHGIAFNTDGTKMFIVGRAGVDVNEYVLSTGFDVSTASYSQNFSVSSQEADPLGIAFNSDGTKMFITGDSNDAVFQYNLSTGFDVSTASYASITFSLSSQDTNPNDIAFSSDGTKMFIIGASGDSVYQYATTPAATTVLAGKALSSTSINLDYTT